MVSCSIGVCIPMLECRRCLLWKISRYSKMALAISTRVFHRFGFSSSTCIRAQSDSTMALSKQSPTDPIDGRSPDSCARRVNAHDMCVKRILDPLFGDSSPTLEGERRPSWLVRCRSPVFNCRPVAGGFDHTDPEPQCLRRDPRRGRHRSDHRPFKEGESNKFRCRACMLCASRQCSAKALVPRPGSAEHIPAVISTISMAIQPIR